MVKPRQTFGDRSSTQVVVGYFRSLEITESIFEAGGKVIIVACDQRPQDFLSHKFW